MYNSHSEKKKFYMKYSMVHTEFFGKKIKDFFSRITLSEDL